MRDDNRELVLMNHKTHLYWMVALVVVGAGLFFSGALSGSALGLLWPLACVGMMVAMVWGMRGRSAEHTHAGGASPSHEGGPVQPLP